jgi:hypothetical protein
VPQKPDTIVEVRAKLVDLSDRKPARSASMSKQLPVTLLGTGTIPLGWSGLSPDVDLDIAETISAHGPKAEATHISYC